MAARALDFAQGHPVDDASFKLLVARLQERVARGEALTLLERDGVKSELQSRDRRYDVKRGTLRAAMKHLVNVADGALEQHPELAGKFVYPSRSTNRIYIAAAKGMLAAATPLKDLFVQLGMGEAFLDELFRAIEAYDAATLAEHNGRTAHVMASAEFTVVVDECVRIVRLLGGLYDVFFRGQPEIVVAWESASNVAGPFEKAGTPPAPPAPSENKTA